MMKASDQYNLNLFRSVVAARAGWKCEMCGHVGDDCQAHHIYSRDNKSVRYDPDNGLFLCDYHHHQWAEVQGTKAVIRYLVAIGKRSRTWRDALIARKNMIVKCNSTYREEWKEKLLNHLREAA